MLFFIKRQKKSISVFIKQKNMPTRNILTKKRNWFQLLLLNWLPQLPGVQ